MKKILKVITVTLLLSFVTTSSVQAIVKTQGNYIPERKDIRI